MKLTTRINNAIKGFQQNSMGDDLPRQFFRRGERMHQEWSMPVMSDQDMYTGHMYGAIETRAITVADLGKNNIIVKANDSYTKEHDPLSHPYLELIRESRIFSEFNFWHSISTYLDLEGRYYLLAVRNYGQLGGELRYGEIQQFELLNPYEVKPVINATDKKLEGYVERRDGMERVIPIHMIIPIYKFNPFKRFDGYAPTDAAKDNQFVLKQSNDSTRHTLQHNINSPGVLSTAEELDGVDLDNFRARVLGHVKGEPIIASGVETGKSGIVWEPMQIDLDKAALKDVNEVGLNGVISTTGVSKTMLGIEQSGVTRDSSRTQKDLFLEVRAVPQLQLIIDALNLDYKIAYPDEYEKSGLKIDINNPAKDDQEAITKSIDNREKRFDLYIKALNSGYDADKAAGYVEGDIDLSLLGEPERPSVADSGEENNDRGGGQNNDFPAMAGQHSCHAEKYTQSIEVSGSLKNGVQRVNERALGIIIDNLNRQRNAINTDGLMGKGARASLLSELRAVLGTFYTTTFLSYLQSFADDTVAKLSGRDSVTFTATARLDSEAKKYIASMSRKVSESHIDTILEEAIGIVQRLAREEASIDQMVSELTTQFSGNISEARAMAVARTETNRAFAMTQYTADDQFMKQNGLEGRLLKQWVVNSPNPCPFCLEMQNKGPIPFIVNFASIGDQVNAEVDGVAKSMKVSFADVQAGSLHVNCGCTYDLVLQ